MNKCTVEEQEELFAKNCKLINLRYEYSKYTGFEKWAIVTELTKEELQNLYPDIICRYTPFVRLSVAQGEVINESNRNTDKYEKRAKRTLDSYGYEDDLSEQFHRELITPAPDPFEEAEQTRIQKEKEKLRLQENEKVRKALRLMKPVQRRRLIKYALLEKTLREIAAEEGVYLNAVKKSIDAATKNFKKLFGYL